VQASRSERSWPVPRAPGYRFRNDAWVLNDAVDGEAGERRRAGLFESASGDDRCRITPRRGGLRVGRATFQLTNCIGKSNQKGRAVGVVGEFSRLKGHGRAAT
jgi:hypothetical protein